MTSGSARHAGRHNTWSSGEEAERSTFMATRARVHVNQGATMHRATNAKPRKRRKDAGQPKELTEEHKRKMREAREQKKKEREKAGKVDLKETVKRLRVQAAKAEREDAKALRVFERSKSDKNFNAWIRANVNLLNAVTALKAHEQRLASER